MVKLHARRLIHLAWIGPIAMIALAVLILIAIAVRARQFVAPGSQGAQVDAFCPEVHPLALRRPTNIPGRLSVSVAVDD